MKRKSIKCAFSFSIYIWENQKIECDMETVCHIFPYWFDDVWRRLCNAASFAGGDC